jgi:hypothetical protein
VLGSERAPRPPRSSSLHADLAQELETLTSWLALAEQDPLLAIDASIRNDLDRIGGAARRLYALIERFGLQDSSQPHGETDAPH